jgi:hypothetical protein
LKPWVKMQVSATLTETATSSFGPVEAGCPVEQRTS